MADINGVQLREPDPVSAEAYVDGGTKIVPIPPKGTHNLQQMGVEWGATKDGYLQAVLTHKVIAPGQVYDGHEVRYDRVNTKRWPNREGSSIGDHLRAFGIPTLPPNNEGYQAYVNALTGRTFEAGLDWEIYNDEKGVKVKGMEAFPDGANGAKQDWVADPVELGKKLYARARVVFRVSKVAK